MQQSLFDQYLRELRNRKPLVDIHTLIQETQKYVSLPSDDSDKPSPHYTGGAVDLSILDSNGEMLPMGTNFDHFGAEATTRHYEEKKIPDDNELKL